MARTGRGLKIAMALTMPDCVRRSHAADAPVRHAWADPYAAYERGEDNRLANRIRRICPKGVAALSAGFAEWIAWRLSKNDIADVLLDYVEATWAGIVDWRYLRPRGSVAGAPRYVEEWSGPVRGPILQACNVLDQAIRAVKKCVVPDLTSANLSLVALHVMPDPKPFKDWRRFAIRRLTALYPAIPGECGPPIPRQALDPDCDYRPEMAADLIAAFLRTLDPATNPFLMTADEMRAEGFGGIPYAI